MMLGCQVSYSETCIQPTDPISGNALDAKLKKRGDSLSCKKKILTLSLLTSFQVILMSKKF